jgi:hypothetical protein
VRTERHKLIYFWKKNQWECYDLQTDPFELNNLYGNPAYEDLVDNLRRELFRQKKAVDDDDRFALEQPPPGVDGPRFKKPSEPEPEEEP